MKNHVWCLGLGLASLACGTTFDPGSKLQTVRVLAIRGDLPYARPGETVKLEALAVDARPSQPTPMKVAWLPAPCVNPPGDTYYACFAGFAKLFQPGQDLTPLLVPGTDFTFAMPPDVISAHPATQSGTGYGVAIAFNFACAGHVQYLPPPAGGAPDTVPFGCFDTAGKLLGPEDFVFSFSTTYAFADRRNANPELGGLKLGGALVDPIAGLSVPHCTQALIDDCPHSSLEVLFPDSAQEVDPSNVDVSGKILNEELWVDFYVTSGKVKNDTEIFFSPASGRLPNPGDDFYAPQAPGDYVLWTVAHDNRGGVNWQAFPLHAS